MTEIEQKKLEIGNRLFELWNLLPELKKSYPKWYQGIDRAIDHWHLSDREKRIAAREKGDAEI